MDQMDQMDQMDPNVIIGNKTQQENIKKYLLNIENEKIFSNIIVGPIGIGKTQSLKNILNSLNLDVYWGDYCDINEDLIQKLNFKCSKNLWGVRRVCVFDNYNESSKNISFLTNVLKFTKIPIFIICNDIYTLSTIEKKSNVYKYIRPTKIQIRNFFEKKGFDINDDLIVMAKNDIRFLMNLCELNKIKKSNLKQLKNDTNENIFEKTKIFFDKSTPLINKLNIFWSDSFILPSMIHENIILNLNNVNLLIESDKYSDDFSLKKYEGILLAHTKSNKQYHKYGKILKSSTSIKNRFKSMEMQTFFNKFIKKNKKSLNMILKLYNITKKEFDSYALRSIKNY